VAQGPQDNASDAAAFSQEDIDALLGGTAPAEGEDAAVDAAPVEAGGGALEAEGAAGAVVDQAAIDALLAGGGAEDGAAPVVEDVPVEAAAAPEVPAVDTRVDTLGRPFDEAAAAMAAAIEEERQAAASAAARAMPAGGAAARESAVAPRPAALDLPELGEEPAPEHEIRKISMLNDVSLRVKIELGRTRMLIEDVLKLDVGSVVELDKLAGDPVDVYVNERLVARGEVLVLNDAFCVRVSDVRSEDPHRVSA